MAVELRKNEPVDVQRLVVNVLRDEWLARTGVGGVLAAGGLVAIMYNLACLPIMAAAWAVMIGYLLRCMRVKVADANAKLPLWNDWGDLFMSGITWIALQTGIWLAVSILLLVLYIVGLDFAMATTNATLSGVETIAVCILVSVSFLLFAVLSAYVMVNFAIEENLQAGFAYRKAVISLFKSPTQLLSGFMLAAGIQSASVILPCLTIIGIFILPSAYFVGAIISSIVLSRHWNTSTEDKVAEPSPKSSIP